MPSTRTWSYAWPTPSAKRRIAATVSVLLAQLEEAVLALPPAGADLAQDVRKSLRKFAEPGPRKAVLAVELVREHAAVVELHGEISRVCPS